MNWASLATYGGLGIGLIGVVLTVYGLLKTLERKDPVLYCSHFEGVALPKRAAAEVQVTYRGQPVRGVTTTLLWLWNKGRRPILRADLVESAPLEIHFDGGKTEAAILDARVARVSRPAVAIAVERRGDAVLGVSFDFLDHRDGAMIEVQHTGSVFTRITASGVILGAPNGVRLLEPFSSDFALFPGNTLMFRLTRPWRDRAIRLSAFAGWLGLAIIWGMHLSDAASTHVRAKLAAALSPTLRGPRLDSAVARVLAIQPGPSLGDRVGVGAMVLLAAFFAWRSIVAARRPMYKIPGTIRPTTRGEDSSGAAASSD